MIILLHLAILVLSIFIKDVTLHIEDSVGTEEFRLLGDADGGAACARPCQLDGVPLVCRFRFVVEWYESMGRACHECPRNRTDCGRAHCIAADGAGRPVLAVNRQMPGPALHVCVGDELIVDVENRLLSEETTVHWHGQHQRGTPYMDGVPYVTQCPIASGASFRYQFRARHAGTHFWHSHSGLQRGEGAFGALVVRQPSALDPHAALYDYDLPAHVLLLQDWTRGSALATFTGHHHSAGDNKPDTLLVNGRGYFHRTNQTLLVPPAKFTVRKGFRYRFRVINAEFLNCPIEVSVDQHTLTVISSDGNNFEPVAVESFVTYAGERFDFVLTANQPDDNYWIRFRGLMDCDERFTSAHQVAVLHYADADPDSDPEADTGYMFAHNPGLQLNALNEGTSNNNTLNIVEMNALVPDDVSLKEQPDYQFYISYDFYNISNPHFYAKGLYEYNAPHPKFRLTTPQLNHISLRLPATPLLSSAAYGSPAAAAFCNESTVHGCEEEYCQCTHVLQVRLGSVVELVLVDRGFTFDANHPFHLHGNAFRVVAMERLGASTTAEEVRELDRAGLLLRKLRSAPLKDTVTVPDGGYTVLRLLADNPGYWLFHCHIDFHAELGMALVLQVGDRTDLPPPPPHFPQCGDFLPDPDPELALHEPQPPACNYTLIAQLLHGLHIYNDCDASAAANSHLTHPALAVFFACIFSTALQIMCRW